ncbi:RNA-dependent DNA polymerase, partial [Streptococcus ruminantium]|nr:RNA-dependent DNA polymerase [Streptococcus ruminantium]
LGFTFDGLNVKIREKSIGKFYRSARKLIHKSHVIKQRKALKKLPNRHKIYSLYTDFGVSKLYRSNFIDYAKRAQRIFDDISP